MKLFRSPRLRGRHFVAFAAIGSVVVGGSLTGLAVADNSPTQVADQVVVRDASGSPALSIQLQQGIEATGNFTLEIQGLGNFTGTIPVTADGTGTSDVNGTTTAAFQADNEPDGPTVPYTVRMDGNIQQDGSASLEIWVGPNSCGSDGAGACTLTKYTLHTRSGSLPKTAPVISAVATDIQTGNWSGLYGLLSSSVTASVTESQFAAGLSSQQAPTIVSVALAGTGTPSVVDGYQYFTQPVTLTVNSGGTPGTDTSSIVLVLENGQWRLLDTTAPQPG